jgi:WD40 repeat protein
MAQSDLSATPDGRGFAVTATDGTLRILDVTGKETRLIQSPGQTGYSAASLSANGRLIGAAGMDQTIRIFEAATGKEVRNLAATGKAAYALRFVPGGRQLLATGGADKTLRFWDVIAGKEVKEVPGHQGLVTALTFSTDGRVAATMSTDGTAIVWDAAALTKGLASPRSAKLTPDELDKLWSNLAEADGARGYEAVWKLAEAPAQAVAMLKERLKTAGVTDETKRIAKLIMDLDDDDFRCARRRRTW